MHGDAGTARFDPSFKGSGGKAKALRNPKGNLSAHRDICAQLDST